MGHTFSKVLNFQLFEMKIVLKLYLFLRYGVCRTHTQCGDDVRVKLFNR